MSDSRVTGFTHFFRVLMEVTSGSQFPQFEDSKQTRW